MELISREEAIKQIQKVEQEPNYQHDYEGWRDGLIIAENIVDELPTVEERKEGEWNFIGWNQFECTCCGYPYTQEQLRAVTTRNDQIFPHFCPNCGAKMKGE